MKRSILIREPKQRRTIPESYADYALSQNEKIRFLLFCGVILMMIAYLFYHSLILSLVFSCLAFPGLKPYRSYLADKRRKELKEQFRDMLYSISASITAGRQMPEALQEAEQSMSLIYGEESLIVRELAVMVVRLKEYREGEEEILKDFAFRTCIEDISDFVDIYLTCRETGGDLVKVLTKASAVIMDKIAIEREIRAITIQKQFEAKILTAIPFLILFFLQLISPDYLSAMYEGLKGRLLMTIALAGIGTAYFWSMKLTRIEV